MVPLGKPKALPGLLAAFPAREVVPSGYLVGGTVRDFLLGREVVDWDLVTPHPEEAISAIREALGGAVVPLDDRVTRVAGRWGHVDVAGLRGDIVRDLAERDFTVNAMAVELGSGRLIDPFGGYGDLVAGTLRVVRLQNLEADPVRLLRGLRFVSTLRMEPEHFTLEAMRAWAHLAGRPAPERLSRELLLLFAGEGAARAVELGVETEVLVHLIPELGEMDVVLGGNNVLDHSVATLRALCEVVNNLDSSPFKYYRKYLDPIIRDPEKRALLAMGALLHDVGKPRTYSEEDGVHFYGHDKEGAQMVKTIARRLRMSNQAEKILGMIVANHMHPHYLGQGAGPTRRALFRFVKRTGQWAMAIVLLAYADAMATRLSHWGAAAHLVLAKALYDYLEFMEAETKKAPRLLSGHDLIDMGLRPGPLFKEILDEVEAQRAEGKIKTKEEALSLARKMAKERGALTE